MQSKQIGSVASSVVASEINTGCNLSGGHLEQGSPTQNDETRKLVLNQQNIVEMQWLTRFDLYEHAVEANRFSRIVRCGVRKYIIQDAI